MPRIKKKTQFPCGSCHKECELGSLFCDLCEQWYHIACDGVSQADLKNFSDTPESYICCTCRSDGDNFDYLHGLARFRQAAKTGYGKLESVVKREIMIAPNIRTYIQPSIPQKLAIDLVADQMLQSKTTACHSRAAFATGNGDCLFNAVSTHLVGNESLANELRYKTCLEMVVGRKDLLKHPQRGSFACLSPTYTEACLSCARLGNAYSSVWTVMVLCNVILTPITTLYPAVNGTNTLPFLKLNTTFSPKDMPFSQTPIRVMWSSVQSPKSSGTWTPNHFVPIVHESLVSRPVSFLPVSSNSTSRPVSSSTTTSRSVSSSATNSRPLSSSNTSSQPVFSSTTTSRPVSTFNTKTRPISSSDTTSRPLSYTNNSRPVSSSTTTSRPVSSSANNSQPVSSSTTTSRLVSSSTTASQPVSPSSSFTSLPSPGSPPSPTSPQSFTQSHSNNSIPSPTLLSSPSLTSTPFKLQKNRRGKRSFSPVEVCNVSFVLPTKNRCTFNSSASSDSNRNRFEVLTSDDDDDVVDSVIRVDVPCVPNEASVQKPSLLISAPNKEKFMTNEQALEALISTKTPAQRVPLGDKNNVYVVLDNTRNINKNSQISQVYRYYTTLKNEQYRKRITTITDAPEDMSNLKQLAVVEYSGIRSNKQNQPHGNAKNKTPYVRTDPQILEECT